jgi:hypothetical protein
MTRSNKPVGLPASLIAADAATPSLQLAARRRALAQFGACAAVAAAWPAVVRGVDSRKHRAGKDEKP